MNMFITARWRPGHIVYHCIIIIISTVLLVAAGMKAISIDWISLEFQSNWFRFNGIQIIAILTESVLSAWLLLGSHREWARRATLILFLVLAVISLYHIVSKSDCGCFGAIHIPPSAIFIFDVSSIIGLGFAVPPNLDSFRIWWHFRSHLAILCAIPVIILSAKIYHANRSRDAVVFVNAKEWMQHPFPLLKYLPSDERSSVQTGDCKIIFFDHDCSRCQNTLRQVAIRNATENMRIYSLDISTSKAENYHSPIPTLKIPSSLHVIADVPTAVTLLNGTVTDIGVVDSD